MKAYCWVYCPECRTETTHEWAIAWDQSSEPEGYPRRCCVCGREHCHVPLPAPVQRSGWASDLMSFRRGTAGGAVAWSLLLLVVIGLLSVATQAMLFAISGGYR